MSLNVQELADHALVRHHLSRLRSIETSTADFRRHITALSTVLAAEAPRDLLPEVCTVATPLETTTCEQLDGRVAAVPILRAGLGMVDPVMNLIPDLEVWHLGLYRDEATAKPVTYYDKLPEGNPVDVALVLDPMLATGGSAASVIQRLREWQVPRILMLSIIAAPEGVTTLSKEFPDVPIFACAVDRELNDQKYICPGLGDAGDRLFNTLPPS